MEVRPATREVAWPGGHEVLQPRVMQVLVVLAQAGGAVLSRDDLIESCWGGRIVGDDSINLVTVKLRKLAQASGESFVLETIPRVGYRLVGAIQGGSPGPGAGRGPHRRGVLVAAGAGTAALGAAAAGYGYWRTRRAGPALTLAVLPFDNLSPNEIAAYIPLGLAREIRNMLSRVAGLRVIAEASSFSLAARGMGASAAGQRLKADLVVTGSVARTATGMELAAELIDVRSGLQVWSDAVSRPDQDLFRLQDSLASNIVQELIARTGPDDVAAPPRPKPRDPDVYRIMLSTNHLLDQTRALRMMGRDPDGDDMADLILRQVQQALAIDGDDSDALVALSVLTRNGWPRAFARLPLSSAERAGAAAEILRHALVSDPSNPSALAVLADYYRRFEWDWEEAETLFRRALAIDPNHVEAHWAYCHMLATIGRAREALGHARLLARLDPETLWRRITLPRVLNTLGARKPAMALYDRELRGGRENLFLLRELYFIHLTRTDPDGLRVLIRTVRRELWGGAPPPRPVQALLTRAAAGVEALEGRPAALLQLVDADVAAFDAVDRHAATRQGRASVDFLFIYAIEYAWSGAPQRAIALLDRALDGRSLYWPDSLPYGPEPFPPQVRGDPAFAMVWGKDEARRRLVGLRRAALERGQMAGVFPDGRRFTPSLPAESA